MPPPSKIQLSKEVIVRLVRVVASALFFCSASVFGGCDTPTFTQQTDLAASHNPLGLASGDFNHDGKLDYATSSTLDSNVTVFLGHGDGTFATGVSYATGGSDAQRPIAADFNNDGYLDLAVIDYNTTDFAVFLNNGDGTFQTAKRTLDIGSVPGSIFAADLDGDGNQDIIVTGSSIKIFYGAGDGTFPTTNDPITQPMNHVPSWAAAADLNGDGKNDLVVAAWVFSTSTRSLDVYQQTATGFAEPVSYTVTGDGDDFLGFGDLNGDGAIDVVMTDESAMKAFVFLNQGDGVLSAAVPYSYPQSPANVVIADINQDGIPDLVFGSVNATSAWMSPGNGDGTFRSPYSVPILAPHYTLQLHGVAVGDVNGDSIPDILLADSSNDRVYYLKNECTAPYVTVALNSSANPALDGDPITFTGTVTAHDGGQPTGTVTFTDGTTVIGSAMLSGATPPSASITVSRLSIGRHAIHAMFPGDGTYGSSQGSLAQIVNQRPFGVPVALTATGDPGTNTVLLQWVGSSGVGSYEIERMTAGTWSVIGSSASESFTDTTPSATKSYFYRVRAHATGTGTPTAYSASDSGTTFTFSANVAPSSLVLAVDLDNLRTAANYMRAAAGLAPMSFTDPAPAGVSIKATHLTELRSGMNEAMNAAGMPLPSFTSIAGGSLIRASDFTQIANSIR